MSLATKYTNGFDADVVWNALKGRIGWRQPTATFLALSNDNKASASGRYFDSFHALCNVINVKSTIADASITDNGFNDLLQSMYKDVVFRCLNGVFNQPELIEEVLLFQREGRPETTIDNENKFVGYEIEIPNKTTISAHITSIVLFFNAVKTFNIYLFKQGVKAPIFTKEVTTVANSETIINVDLVLQYLSSEGHGNTFYLGYFQSDLGNDCKAIDVQTIWNKTLCFSAEPFSSDKVSSTDFKRTEYSETTLTYGMNLVIGSFKDHTQSIARKPFLFDEVIGLQMTAQVIEGIMHSTRSNGTERILKDSVDKLMVYLDLKGTVPISDAPSTTGIAKQIERELVRLKKTFFPKPKAITINQCH